MKHPPNATERLLRSVSDMKKDDDVIIRKAWMNKPFIKGDPNAKLPSAEDQLEFITNPKRTKADVHLDAFGEALKGFRCGHYPRGVIESWRDSTIKVIKELEKVGRDTAFNVSMTVVEDFANYLLQPNDETEEEHAAKIDEYIGRLKRRFCQNSDACYNQCSEEIKRREAMKSASLDYAYEKIVIGEYAKSVVDFCDRKEGIVSIIGVGRFYISPDNSKAWKIIRMLVETDAKDGYVYLFNEGHWRGSFPSSKQGVIPEDKLLLGCRSAYEFSMYIHAKGRNGFFRIERTKTR